MNKFKALGFALVFGASSATLQASDFSYSYIDLGFGVTINENTDNSGEFKTISGSFQTATGPFIAFESTGYEDEADSNGEGGYNIDLTAVGVGTFFPTGAQTDLYTVLQLVSVDLGETGDESGFRVSAGFRSAFGGNLELDAKVKYEDVYEESDTSFGISARYYLAPSIALSAQPTFETIQLSQ